MIKRPLLACLLLAAALSAGCLHFKKNSAPKDTTITGEVEGPFRQRWIDRRATELVAQGKTADVARAQATAEFAEHFGAIGTPPKK